MVESKKRLVAIYKSQRKDEMYLYVDHQEGLDRVPEALMAQFGQAIETMKLLLTPERKLARAEVGDVLKAIEEQGFYLQIPPPLDEFQQKVVQARELNPAVSRRSSQEAD